MAAYEPEFVDQRLTLEALLRDREPQLWVLYGEPGSGKSYTLHEVAREHTRLEQELAQTGGEFAVIVDFAEDEKLACNKRGVMHLLYDRLGCDIPDAKAMKRNPQTGEDKTRALLEEFMVASPFNNGLYVGRQILFGFDSLHLAVEEDMLRWLREDVAQTLVGDPPWVGAQAWMLNQGTPIAKVVMVVRYGGIRFPPPRDRRWSDFERS